MEIVLKEEGQKLTVALSGRLDSTNVHELEEKLKAKRAITKELVFDFTGLEYLSSAGLRVLLASHKLLSGRVMVCHANKAIKDIFALTGMNSFLNLED